MKRAVLLVLWMALLAFVGCRKDPQPQGNVPVVKLYEDKLLVSHTKVQVVAEVTESSGLDIIAKGFAYGVDGSFQDTVFCNNDTIGYYAEIIGLLENTTYFVKAFAKNSIGTGESEIVSFATKDNDLPEVRIKDIVLYTTSAGVNCVVADDGGSCITARGVCWSTSHDPTVEDHLVEVGTGMGDYACPIFDLNYGITYFVRAYATNSKGTAYSEQREFVKWPQVMNFSVNEVGFKMIWVQGGMFCMGAQRDDPNGRNFDEDAYDDEGPVHDVFVDSYYIGETVVTQELWEAVVGNTPSHWHGMLYPVEQVSWDDIVDVFLPRLNELTGYVFRLPTEAEWEYAARGGNKSKGYKYSGSNAVNECAYYNENSHQRTGNVTLRTPNELLLYGMSGNVWEWCSDWYGDYENEISENPQGPSNGRCRVLRGGSCLSLARFCRTASRNCNAPDYRNYACGFRLVLSVK